MKKIFALVLAIAMIAAMSVTVFAHQVAGVHSDAAVTPAEDITAKYVLDESWSVSLPAADVTVGVDTAEITITAAAIDWDHKIDVTVDSTNDWELTNDDTGLADAPSITYKATLAGADVTESTVLATAQAADLGTLTVTNGELSFALVDTVKVAGDYSDTLTFTVAVNEIDARIA